MSNQDKKCREYAALLVLLSDYNMLSISLEMEFKKAIARSCGMTSKKVDDAISYAQRNLDFEVSIIYWEYKQQSCTSRSTTK